MKMTKTWTRVLSLLLMLTMLLSLMAGAAVAFASDVENGDGDSDESGNASTADVALITPGATGSIKVTKFVTSTSEENSDPPVATPTGNATGTGNDAGTIDGSYSTLQGAEFILVKIYDEKTVLAYYDGTVNSEPVLDPDLLDVGTDDDDNVKVTYDGKDIEEGNYWIGETNENGVFTFENKPIGFYVLKEITELDRIIGLCEPAIISLPMVNTKTSSNNDNAKWLYDIEVFPKNVTKKSSVTVEKKDTAGSPLGNVTFQLYKADINAAGTDVGDWSQVNDADGYNSTVSAYVTDNTGVNIGNVTIGGLTAAKYGTVYKLVEVFTEGTSPNGYIVDMTPIYFHIDKDRIIHWDIPENVTNIEKNEDVGTRFAGEAPDVADNKVDLTFTLRNEHPTVQKQVKRNEHSDAGDEWKDDEEYQIGEEITYKVTVLVPRNVESLDKFTIIDTPSVGLTDIATGVTVTVVNGNALTENDDFKVSGTKATDNAGAGIEVTFTEDGLAKIAGNTIEVEYTAKLNEKAEIAGAGNLNTASLVYDQVIDPEEKMDNEPEYTIKDSANVYTYQLELTKYLDTTPEKTKAKGVEFQLLDSGKNPISVVLVEGNTYRIATAGETPLNYTTENMETGSDGILVIQGLENTKYFLKEIKTVDNYNLLSDPFEININITENTEWTDSSSSATKTEQNNKTNPTVEFGADDAKATAEIINRKGFVLPQTGSMGYLLFCAAGLLLIGGGAALIFSDRKKVIR